MTGSVKILAEPAVGIKVNRCAAPAKQAAVVKTSIGSSVFSLLMVQGRLE